MQAVANAMSVSSLIMVKPSDSTVFEWRGQYLQLCFRFHLLNSFPKCTDTCVSTKRRAIGAVSPPTITAMAESVLVPYESRRNQ